MSQESEAGEDWELLVIGGIFTIVIAAGVAWIILLFRTLFTYGPLGVAGYIAGTGVAIVILGLVLRGVQKWGDAI